MPIPIALLQHPVAVYGLLVVALAGLVYGGLTHSFVSLVVGGAAALLAVLAFATTPPSHMSLLLIAVGIVLINIEFRLPTFGIAGLAGCCAMFTGSLLVLAPSSAFTTVLGLPTIAVAGAGTIVLLLAIYGAQRRITLPR